MPENKKPVADPLEAAKLAAEDADPPVSKKASRKAKKQDDDPGKKLEQADKPPAPPSLPPKATYVVQRKITISWGPQMITLHEGKVITEGSMGTGDIEKLRNAGVALKEV